MTLILTPNMSDADGFYQDLITAHDGLSKAQSDRLTARLVLILANQIGARDVLKQALCVAAEDVGAP
jgi:hypothetical protein